MIETANFPLANLPILPSLKLIGSGRKKGPLATSYAGRKDGGRIIESFGNEAVAKYRALDIIVLLMSAYSIPIDINNFPDLKRLAREARKTGRRYVLRENSQDIAVLTPINTGEKQKTDQQAIEETLALAGSWKDLDFDDMIEQLDRIRHESKPTPPLELDL